MKIKSNTTNNDLPWPNDFFSHFNRSTAHRLCRWHP